MVSASEVKLFVQKPGKGDACSATLLSSGSLAARVPLLWQSTVSAVKGSEEPQPAPFLASASVALRTVGLCASRATSSSAPPLNQIAASSPKKAVPGDAHPREPARAGGPGGSRCPLTSETPGTLVPPGKWDRIPREERLRRDGLR